VILFNPNCFVNTLPPNTIKLGGEVSIYERGAINFKYMIVYDLITSTILLFHKTKILMSRVYKIWKLNHTI
jgi:hypothetical protein